MPSYYTPKDPMDALSTYFDDPGKQHVTINPYSTHAPVEDLYKFLGSDVVHKEYGTPDAIMSQA